MAASAGPVESNQMVTKKNITTDSILQLLVTEDLSSIRSTNALKTFFTQHLNSLPPKVISEVLSVLIAIVKKSVFHLESARGLIFSCIQFLVSFEELSSSTTTKDGSSREPDETSSNLSLTKHFLREWVSLLIAHSCEVEELKSILKLSEHDSSLLNFIQQANLKQRNRPNAFFAFPGSKGSFMSLPPFHKWPIQLGWSFSTWFFLEPKTYAQPYLFNFKTGKSGLGYSAHFTGNCLVLTSIRVKGKGVQHCVAFEFPSYKWIHCAITYHNKWRASEIKVYVNGQLTANIDMAWQVQTNEMFDKCFIGGSGWITGKDQAGNLNCFCGQMSAIYLFNEGLSATQICALHRLGPSYMGQFKYSNESCVNLPPQICRTLYEEKLSSSLFCLFTPVAVDSGALCIQMAPFKSSTSVSAQNFFTSAPHAALQGETKAIITQPICFTLQSIGCARSLLPLLDAYARRSDSSACASLIGFLCDLLESSPHWFSNEIVQNNGFVIVASILSNNSRILLTEKLLDVFLSLTRTLLTTASSACDSLLLKHLLDNILFNPALWVYAEPAVQLKLYNYLATEFLHGTRHGSNRYTICSSSNANTHLNYSPTSNNTVGSANQTNTAFNHEQVPKLGPFESSSIVADLLFGEIRRVSTVLQSLHALKYYYWIVEEPNINHKAKNSRFRPDISELKIIRSNLLQFTKELISRSNTTPLDETQGLLNYLSACSKAENLLDVLDTLSDLISDQPTSMIVAFDQKQGIRVLYTLIGSSDERVCIRALRLLNLFLSHCSYKKRHEIMGPSNLFMLLCDRLRIHLPLSLDIYEALIDLLIEENNTGREINDKRPEELSSKSIVNSTVIKVIATLIHEQRSIKTKLDPFITSGTKNTKHDIRDIFINDLWNLIVNSRENRRIILQMSVWQHWLINLINSTLTDCPLVKDQILAIFRVLLYHAIRYEYGGWRVWIDTLAIIHAKVSYDGFCQQSTRDSPTELVTNDDTCGQNESNEQTTKHQSTLLNDEHMSNKETIAIKEDVVEVDGKIDDHLEVDSEQAVVSSISKHVMNESRGLEMADDIEQEQAAKVDVPDIDIDKTCEQSEQPQEGIDDSVTGDMSKETGSMDSVDLAPSRAFRQNNTTAEETSPESEPATTNEVIQQQSMTTIPLEDCPSSGATNEVLSRSNDISDAESSPAENKLASPMTNMQQGANQTHKATASPAFRVPEFKWSNILIKLLNDLMFSIECDLYHWRCLAKLNNLDNVPFVPRTVNSTPGQSSGQNASTSNSSSSSATTSNSMETLLQKPENQIYITNVIHLVSQLADNIIIASGGLLPLLADATGGTRSASSPSASPNDRPLKSVVTCEGLTLAQSNSILYRLVNMVDMVVFAATHVNLNELEADKNTTAGGIMRQCLRLVCTVTVKNCLILRGLSERVGQMCMSETSSMMTVELPKDMFDSYHGCSLLSANGLFEQSALTLEHTDLIANLEYSPNQNPNTSSMPSVLPFQTSPIKNPNKLIQLTDIQRIQACIYHGAGTGSSSGATGSSIESRQSQFLALSSLYFISVLMVSKYRDIIEPKGKTSASKKLDRSDSGRSSPSVTMTSKESASESSQPQTTKSAAISSIEANLLTFGKMQPNVSSNNQQQQQQTSSVNTNSLTNMLTTKLENTLDTVCPLLKSIMCDFCTFLSKTLIGSHGQDLVNKEAERTFRRTNASPVELVMLLCSQEWQNTLQKNAGLAFIELINEGRVLSHGMKDHIVRVAMEADFILSRLRADDVSKHEHFGLACSESLSTRLHEEVLINSLISSAARRDHVLYCKFNESILNESRRNYKLDIWEDDDRRKRRFVFDSWPNSTQNFYISSSNSSSGCAKSNVSDANQKDACDKSDTQKRILDLQKTIELGGIDDHCSPAGAVMLHPGHSGADESDAENDYDDDEVETEHDNQCDSVSPNSEPNDQRRAHNVCDTENNAATQSASSFDGMKHTRSHDAYQQQQQQQHQDSLNRHGQHQRGATQVVESNTLSNELELRHDQAWDYDECGSVNDFTGSVIFAAEASLVWSIYAIPGILQITQHELHFEPNQNIIEAIDALKRSSSNTTDDHQASSETDEAHLKSLKSLTISNQQNTVADISSSSSSSSERISLRKIDLKALRYCDFLTCNGKVLLCDIRAIFSRHYLLQPNALEIFVSQRTSVMFAFADFDIVKRVVKYLPPVGVGIKYGIQQSRRASLMSPRQLFAASNMTQRWQKREIGNFQYLMFLNTIAGRTYQDLNQYPVFPWILTDYESDELDLNLPKNFRDLSKPIGALNSKRRTEFMERYQTWDNPKVPAFHYGTHYSTAAFTLNWLSRLRGMYNSSYLALQDGKYEESSRLFLSIGDSWVTSLSGGQQNVKELIPEFFYLPEMFHAQLGLPDVEYPPWAKSGEEFVRMHRMALESELVSCQLHQWIDLIFGYKQRGPEAINAVNTFYYLTYQGNVNLNMIRDPALRDAIETQIKHFGQTPSQLSTEPHPPRFSALHASPLVYSTSVDEINKVVKFPFNNPIVHISSCINNYIATTAPANDTSSATGTIGTSKSLNSPSSVVTITSNNQYQIHKWMLDDQTGHPFTIDPQLESASGARRQLIDVEDMCSMIPLKLSSNSACIDQNAITASAASAQQDTVDEVQWPCAHYVVTLNGKYIIMGSFYDNSFRVFTTESGKLCQVIYGHRGPITCIARGEGNSLADFHIATGGLDCSLLLWTWNEKYAQVEGSGVSTVHNPLPKLSICGHQTPVLSALICTELGLIVSGSKNLVLVHTITTGENLLNIKVELPHMMDKTLLEHQQLHATDSSIVHRPQVVDKEKTILEASMLGDQKRSMKESTCETTSGGTSRDLSSQNDCTHSVQDERLSQLKSLCHSDYYITSLQLAREMAFIVCVALPAPQKRRNQTLVVTNNNNNNNNNDVNNTNTREGSAAEVDAPVVKPRSPALLLTFNLKGLLMDSTPIGQSASSPKLGDVCVLRTTRDGEHIILNDSPITVKIFKTFGLQPIYAFNTNDIPNIPLSEDQNRIRSLALLDHKYILVGLENGKVIVYNCDFKNFR